MTTLSWILILASITDGMRLACGLLAGLFLIIGGFYIIYMCGWLSYEAAPKGTSKKWPIICFAAMFILAVTSALMPDKKTVYMVAGVETINKFAQTDVAKELGDSGLSIVKDVTAIIHSYVMDDVKGLKEPRKGKKRHDDDDDE